MTRVEKFRFRGADFRYNPRSIQIRRERRLVRLQSPAAGSVVQELGFLPAVVSGEGELCGEAADSDYQNLRGLFEAGGSGLLQIPGQPPMRAFFAALGMLRRAGPDVLRYSFSFVEDVSGEGLA